MKLLIFLESILHILLSFILFVLIISFCSCKSLYETNRIVKVTSFDGELYHGILRDYPDSIIFKTTDILEINQTYLIGENCFKDLRCIPIKDDYVFSGNSNILPINELLKHK
jgi:hypothetical protein